MRQELSSDIEKLIQSHREDEWWDFKREHSMNILPFILMIIQMMK